jgi:Domain of unknown function (DUF3883)
MADIKTEKSGTTWRDDELDLIVADYFSMLSAELSGKPYIKSRHSAALMEATGRSHRSVEFKHQNISAVLDELGMSWIAGYKPKRNYQNAIFDAIDRYLTKYPGILEPSPRQQPILPDSGHVFVDPPVRQPSTKEIPKRLRQLIAKFDPVERDERNRSLGRAGESFVVDLEKRRLISANRSDLALKVRWVSAEEGDGAGYDIASFSLVGHPQLIEVKTTNGSCRTPFFLSRNEYNTSKQFSEEWLIYRVHLFATTPRIFTIVPPLESSLTLTTETWRAAF